MKVWEQISIILVSLLAGMFLSWLIRPHILPSGGVSPQIDTIYHVDTIKVAEPKEIIKERRIEIRDTMMIAVRDTIRRNDTIYIQIPREVKVYEGEDYRCEVSGIQPRLDNIWVYPETKIVTERIKPPRWGVGLSCGIGLDRNFKPALYVGAGITYNLFFIGK